MSGTIEADARRAQDFLDDSFLQTILKDMQADAVNVWISARSPEQREAAWHDYQSIVRFLDKLKSRLTEVTMRAKRRT